MDPRFEDTFVRSAMFRVAASADCALTKKSSERCLLSELHGHDGHNSLSAHESSFLIAFRHAYVADSSADPFTANTPCVSVSLGYGIDSLDPRS
jgi:hypothetical protein